MKSIHPLQSSEWARFREKTGVKVINPNGFFLTLHPVPYANYFIGYLPKGPEINKKLIDILTKIGTSQNCIFIQLEPFVERQNTKPYKFKNLVSSAHPLFTKYNLVLDLTKSEEELLKNMHPKTRYNIRLAEKKEVKVVEDNSKKAFEDYLKLTKETTTRQKFYAHSEKYHRLMWETLKNKKASQNRLSAHLLRATYNGEVLATWILFVLGDTLYYPYGASSIRHKEVMASNLMMWEAIKFGKKLGLKKFDMWGSLGPDADPKDPWYGFHKFKLGYGPKLVEYVGSYDLVIKPYLYITYKLFDKVRWFLLRLK